MNEKPSWISHDASVRDALFEARNGKGNIKFISNVHEYINTIKNIKQLLNAVE